MIFNITCGEDGRPCGNVRVNPVFAEGQTQEYEIAVEGAQKKVRLGFRMPMRDHVSVWHPTCGRNRGLPQWFHPQKTDACFYRGAPVLAALRADGTVYCIVSLSDPDADTALGYYVDDFSETDEVVFFAELANVPAGYRVTLRINTSAVPLPEALGQVWQGWRKAFPREAPLPETAFAPLYSTWYNFHQTPSQAALTQELRLASALGFRTVILDDGWQISGAGTQDYRRSGDWIPAPDKFPDFGGFVKDVHALGMKLILWFAVPFVGFETEAYRRFKDRLLFEQKGFIYAGVLDVRYKEVRDYITGTYTRFIDTYDIDGLKLDFIDNFRSADAPPYNDRMDAETVTQGVQKLLAEVCAAAVARKPDFLFEYRQFYVGPGIMRFANMLRVCDCAFDAVTNRIGAVDLRMLTRNVAVHADMLLWSPAERPENCALQLLNIMFAVPQISVRLTEASEEQRRLLRVYLAYRERNRDLLLCGSLSVLHPETGYAAVRAADEKTGRAVTVLYAQSLCRYHGLNEDIWNAAGPEPLALLNPERKRLLLTLHDCFCTPLREIRSNDEVICVSVPLGGYLNVCE